MEQRTKQKDSFAFVLDGSTPRSLSLRFSRLVIISADIKAG